MKRKPNSIGDTLRGLREKKGLGIKTVGKELDISYSYISKVENGHRLPNQEFIERLSALYGADSEELLAKMAELPPDIQSIVQTHGKDVFELLRSLYAPKTAARKRGPK
jgi:transcriptional regulator with XRE-family HTH domain